MLVEPLASQRGGHPGRSLPLLAAAAARAGRPVTVVAADGVDPDIRTALDASGARVVTGPVSPVSLGALLLKCAGLLAATYRALRPRMPERPLPYQLELLSRCLLEAGSLRVGRKAFEPGAPVTAVVLT